jgi:hypothetical protein
MNGGRRPTFSDVGVSPEKYLRADRLALRRPPLRAGKLSFTR